MKNRAILHIGVEKTGTTSLQLFLQRNRARLSDRGVAYPRFCGEFNHVGLAALAMDDDRDDPLRLEYAPRGAADLAAMRSRMAEAARSELAGGGDAIFCNEHCHSRLTRPSEVRRLKAFLDPYFDRVDVCIYLRRQDRLVVSLYATHVKSGGERLCILPPTDGSDTLLNYQKSLELWMEVFGNDNIHPFIFESSELHGGSIIDDFVVRWGLGDPDEFERTPNENESISAAAIEFLRRINPRLTPVVGPLERVRGPLAALLGRLAPGAPLKPARSEAAAFLAMFAASNEEVRKRFFPTRATLFDESFEDYPESETARALAEEDILSIAARLHERSILEKHRLEHEIALREATIGALCGDWRSSEAAARTALNWVGDSAEAHYALAAALLRQQSRDEALRVARAGSELNPNHRGLAEQVAALSCAPNPRAAETGPESQSWAKIASARRRF